jgi:hypothetical protein
VRADDRDFDVARRQVLRRQRDREPEERGDPVPSGTAVEALDVDGARLPTLAQVLADLSPEVVRRVLDVQRDDRQNAFLGRRTLLGPVRRVVDVLDTGGSDWSDG